MAFAYFKKEQVDVAVIEVGLGGRLDCTNIISPDLSIITNISFDHMALLGDTLTKIASEKAGIIKKNIPVIIGEYVPETRKVFKIKQMRLVHLSYMPKNKKTFLPIIKMKLEGLPIRQLFGERLTANLLVITKL